MKGHSLGLGLSSLTPSHQLVAALVSDLGVLNLQLDDRLAIPDLGLLLLDGVSASLPGGDLMPLLEPLDVNVLSALDGALEHNRLLLLDLLNNRSLADHWGHLDVEGQVGVDLPVFIIHDTFVKASILGSWVLEKVLVIECFANKEKAKKNKGW